jgi:hypothetical protein
MKGEGQHSGGERRRRRAGVKIAGVKGEGPRLKGEGWRIQGGIEGRRSEVRE